MSSHLKHKTFTHLKKDHMFYLYTVKTIQHTENTYFSQGNNTYTLMKQAANVAWQICLDTLLCKESTLSTAPIAILVGAGGNGGDALVMAVLAKQARYEVKIYSLLDASHWQPVVTNHHVLNYHAINASQQAYADFINHGLKLEQPPENFAQQPFSLIIDGLFGIGLNRDLSVPYQTLIQQINQNPAPVLAIDIPSGLHADTGIPLPCAINAHITVTMIAPKIGLFNALAANYRGDVYVAPLDVPIVQPEDNPAVVQHLSINDVLPLLPKRLPATHKGEQGHALLVGGADGMAGALQLTAITALRTGSGRVSAWCESALTAATLVASEPEVMFAQTKTESYALLKSLKILAPNIIAIGTGLGQGTFAIRAMQLLDDVLTSNTTNHIPLVLDADALNMLAKEPRHHPNWILTPHPGEAARLLHCSTQTINQDRITSITKLWQQYGGVIILKGSNSLCFDGKTLVTCSYGSPAMATAGLGDVLTGLCAALLAQGMPLFDAAKTAMILHAKAGEIAADGQVRGMMARELITALNGLVNPSF